MQLTANGSFLRRH